MDEKYSIPSEAEIYHMQTADALRKTKVEMTLRITGGAIMDGETIILTVPELILEKAGQLEFTVHEEDVSGIDYSWDSLPPTPRRWISLNIDRGSLELDQVYTLQVERKTDGS